MHKDLDQSLIEKADETGCLCQIAANLSCLCPVCHAGHPVPDLEEEVWVDGLIVAERTTEGRLDNLETVVCVLSVDEEPDLIRMWRDMRAYGRGLVNEGRLPSEAHFILELWRDWWMQDV
jgi:hypothetical protein